jgi:hypothetical protein
MWTQIIGKVKLELTYEWWNVTFALTARGLTTSTISFDERTPAGPHAHRQLALGQAGSTAVAQDQTAKGLNRPRGVPWHAPELTRSAVYQPALAPGP